MCWTLSRMKRSSPPASRPEEFYKVTFEEQEGYVHKDWVFIVSGVCEEPVEEE